MTLRKLERIANELNDFTVKNELNQIERELIEQIEKIGAEWTRDAIDFYLRNKEEEPFYFKLRELDKTKIAAHLGKSRSYVYNAIRKRSLTASEKEAIAAAYSDLL